MKEEQTGRVIKAEEFAFLKKCFAREVCGQAYYSNRKIARDLEFKGMIVSKRPGEYVTSYYGNYIVCSNDSYEDYVRKEEDL